MASRVIIQHISGAKANQIEQFPVEGLVELSMGRDPSCSMVFDAQRDDAVSRRHAVIRIENGDHFKLVDLGSQNGTRVNDELVSGEVELAAADVVELGAGGPKFRFDVQPRPPHFMARTRFVSKNVAATRILSPADIEAAAKAAKPAPEPAKSGIGRNTVIGMMSAQQSRTNKKWMYVLAGVLVLVAAGGGGLYFHNKIKAEEAAVALAKQAEELKAQREAVAAAAAKQAAELLAQKEAAEKAAQKAKEEHEAALKRAVGLNPQEIVRKYGNAVVMIELGWQLFDKASGKPVYQKVVRDKDGVRYPAYVLLGNNKIVRWLTTEDENGANVPIGSSGSGTGFVISGQGYILTNKHVAAGWMVDFDKFLEAPGYVFAIGEKLQAEKVRSLRQVRELADWVPDRGPVFRPDVPVPLGGPASREFEGRNSQLDVRFPGSPLRLSARLMRASVEADAAIIKVDVQQPLTTVELSDGNVAAVGEQVTVLGYPGFSKPLLSQAIINSTELGGAGRRMELVPEPTVTSGNISLIVTSTQRSGGMTTIGPGDAYQLTVPSGPGNSGGPVFDRNGKVIGIYTYGSGNRETQTYAIPIKFGIDLLAVQRVSPN